MIIKTIILNVATLLFLVLNVQSQASIFNVKDFGATGIKDDEATTAIKKAINECEKNGGGTIFFPAGDYRSLPIKMVDNMTLYLDAGATLYADLPSQQFKGGSFILAENLKNISIKGMGVFDGQAKHVWKDYNYGDVEITKEVEIAKKTGVEMKRSYRIGNAAQMMLVKNCDNVLIEDVTLLNSSTWNIHLHFSNHVTIRGIKIYSDLKMGVNSDGIDINGTSNVHISGCTISCGDDAIVIKTGPKDYRRENNIEKPIGEGMPSENIIVDNCILTTSSTALIIGTETTADVRHVVFSNCVIRKSNKGFGINVQDGATVSDVLFSNITMDLERRHWNWWGDAEAFYFVLKKRLPGSKEGTIKNIRIQNVMARAQGPSKIITTIGKPLEDISLTDFTMIMEPEATPDKRTSQGLIVDGVDNLELRDVKIDWTTDKTEPKWEEAILMKNVNGFVWDDIHTRQSLTGSGFPAIRMVNCQNGTIRNSSSLPGSDTFLQFEGDKTSALFSITIMISTQRHFLKKVTM